ncbi:efflux transporter outer membrane subunit [Sunxiuqinia indica]|uniref:efflux transporter outer membrane subunit n=1 Tax=Sunxiuqinia indica TaxID=2692584 RepID=UPI001359D224|nr:efflux transporter outer membrane subunit [Sunxiuqinia indica]
MIDVGEFKCKCGKEINRRTGIVMLIVIFIVGCSPKTTTESIPIQRSAKFSDTGTATLSDKWWEAFNDPQLNRLVDSALYSNFNLKTAWERLKAAQAVVKRQSSNYYPFVDASLRAEKNRSQSQFRDSEVLQLGLSADYEVDLWGKIKSSVEAERYRAQASYADFQTAALSLSAEIATTWFQLIEAKNQLKLASSQVDINEQVLRSIKARFGYGQVRGVDILRQQQLLEATRERELAARVQLKLLEHQLAVLLGKTPTESLSLALDSLPDLPPLPQTGLPVELVERRPDVQNAYNLLQAADRDLAAAISNRYPRLNISASISTAAINADKLFDDWAYSVAGNLLAPLFYGRQINAEIERSEAIKNQYLYAYGQAVLTAFREVEDALVQEAMQQQTIANLKEQVKLSEKTYKQLQLEYFNGMSNYLDVLTALNAQQELQRSLLAANLTLLKYRILLYRALAGGFDLQLEKVSDAGDVLEGR